MTSQNQEDQYEALEKYGMNLVQAVRSGKQDPVIGEDKKKSGMSSAFCRGKQKIIRS